MRSGPPEILGPDLSPFHTALGTGTAARSTLRLGEKTYFQVHATPIISPSNPIPCYLVVSVRDVSAEVLQQQKLSAIYQAGLELGDLSPPERRADKAAGDDARRLHRARRIGQRPGST